MALPLEREECQHIKPTARKGNIYIPVLLPVIIAILPVRSGRFAGSGLFIMCAVNSINCGIIYISTELRLYIERYNLYPRCIYSLPADIPNN